MKKKIKNIVSFGVDPGIGNTGWTCVSRRSRCDNFVYLGSGVIFTPLLIPTPQRIYQVPRDISKRLFEYALAVVCIEGVFSIGTCPRVCTAEIIGAVWVAFSAAGARVLIEKPQTIKSVVGLGGSASKNRSRSRLQSRAVYFLIKSANFVVFFLKVVYNSVSPNGGQMYQSAHAGCPLLPLDTGLIGVSV